MSCELGEGDEREVWQVISTVTNFPDFVINFQYSLEGEHRCGGQLGKKSQPEKQYLDGSVIDIEDRAPWTK